jgi:putative flavoprotein involved in K+ transport
MRHIDTVIVGAGQAGLAASHELTQLGHEHVLLDRLSIGDRWERRRWDSQTLLTPNWMTRLPGGGYDGPHPDQFMPTDDFAGLLREYAHRFDAPVEAGVNVERLQVVDEAFTVTTDAGRWAARNVIVATGWCDIPAVPAAAVALHPALLSLTSDAYRNPGALPDGGVLVVGASATGAQLADELRRDGRRVVLAVGNHVRLPRRYRGADIMTWLDRSGTFDRCIDDMPDPSAAVRESAAQLVGWRDGPRAIDLPSLAARGVELVGRLVDVQGRTAYFDDGLAARGQFADHVMHRVLDKLDRYIAHTGLAIAADDSSRPHAFAAPVARPALDLVGAGIRTVIWASGYRRDYGWLPHHLLDARGELRHRHGATELAGLMALGLRFQRTRRSNFIDGVGADASVAAIRAHARASAFSMT